MKIKIGPYTNWFGPYQLAEALCFWVKEVEDENGFPQKPDWIHDFGEYLAYGSVLPDEKITRLGDDREDTRLSKFLQYIESKKKRKIEIQIDKWDTWGMDHTLAMIILPMLIQLKETKHGSPTVDDKDLPKKIRAITGDDAVHEKWDWVMDEMIWAFTQLNDDDNDAQFHTGEHDIYFEKCDDGTGNSEMKNGPNNTHVFDSKGYEKHSKRIQRGTTLFGKYFRGLWD